MNNIDEESNPLMGLFEDRAEAIDLDTLAATLKGLVRLFSDTREIVTTSSWDKLNLQQKILTFMLAKKVFTLTKVQDEADEGVSPADIEAETGLKGGSIRPTISKLVDARLIRLDKQTGKYIVPQFAVSKACNIISIEEGK